MINNVPVALYRWSERYAENSMSPGQRSVYQGYIDEGVIDSPEDRSLRMAAADAAREEASAVYLAEFFEWVELKGHGKGKKNTIKTHFTCRHFSIVVCSWCWIPGLLEPQPQIAVQEQ